MEEDRISGRKQKVRTKSLIRDYGIAISDECNARTLFERRHARSIDKLHERIEFKSSSSAGVIQDLSEQVQLLRETSSKEMQSYASQVVGHQKAMDAVCELVRDTDAQFDARLGRIEEMFGIHASSDSMNNNPSASNNPLAVQNLLGSAPSTMQSTMQSTMRSVSPSQTHESPPNAEIGVLESAALAPNMPQTTVAQQALSCFASARAAVPIPMAVPVSGPRSASVVVAQPVGIASSLPNKQCVPQPAVQPATHASLVQTAAT